MSPAVVCGKAREFGVSLPVLRQPVEVALHYSAGFQHDDILDFSDRFDSSRSAAG